MAKAGHEWTPWFDRHGPALLLLARQWLREQADAEDVVQEAFVRFWRSRHKADDPAAYLFACVKRCAIDYLRSRQRRLTREEAAARERAITGETFFVTDPQNQERRDAVEAAMMRLPIEQREVLVMKIWAGLTFAQIGRSLEIRLNTAASRYRYALNAMRDELTEELIP